MGTLADFQRTIQPQSVSLEHDFFYEFGKFICTFANAENAIHRLFERVSGLNEDRARAIVAGQDISKMMEFTKRIATVIPKGRFSQRNREEMELLFHQLSAISIFRSSLVHSGAKVSETTIRSINYNKAKTREGIQEITFGIADVRNATFDLMVISLRIYHLVKADKWSRKNIGWLRREPWRYKSLRPNNWWARMLADTLRQPRPPQSSGA